MNGSDGGTSRQAGSEGTSRRSLLRKAVVAGGLLWTAPAILGTSVASAGNGSGTGPNCCQFISGSTLFCVGGGFDKASCVNLGGSFWAGRVCCPSGQCAFDGSC